MGRAISRSPWSSSIIERLGRSAGELTLAPSGVPEPAVPSARLEPVGILSIGNGGVTTSIVIHESASMRASERKSPSTTSTRRQPLVAALAGLGGAAAAACPSLPAALSRRRLQVQMRVHPGMTALDRVAPQRIFATMGDVDTHPVWKDLSPVTANSGLKILPQHHLCRCDSRTPTSFACCALRA